MKMTNVILFWVLATLIVVFSSVLWCNSETMFWYSVLADTGSSIVPTQTQALVSLCTSFISNMR